MERCVAGIRREEKGYWQNKIIDVYDEYFVVYIFF